MYDKEKVIPGILVFIVLFTSPIWYNLGAAMFFEKNAFVEVEIEIDRDKHKQCVESREYMIANHMDLLNDWRDSVVREGNRVYHSKDHPGETFNMSLTNTCLDCHDNYTSFCDRCHTYAAVKPICWDCHVIPEEKR